MDLAAHFWDKGHNILDFVKNVIGLGHGTLQDFKKIKWHKRLDMFDEIKQDSLLIYNGRITCVLLLGYVPFKEGKKTCEKCVPLVWIWWGYQENKFSSYKNGNDWLQILSQWLGGGHMGEFNHKQYIYI